MRRHLPNAITLLRLVALLPLLVWAILEERAAIAAATLVAIGLSDVVDGWLARRWNVRSRVGAALDPAADKLTQVAGLVLLALAPGTAFTRIPPLFVSLVFARDLILAYGAWRIRRSRGTVRIQARWPGKASTALVFLLLLASLLAVPPAVVHGLSAAIAPLVVLSGWRYFREGLRQMRAEVP